MRIYLVRHGQSIANLQGVHQGSYDTGLTKHGKKEAKAVRDQLQNTSFAQIYTSHLLRAAETAQIIHKKHPNSPLTTTPLLEERKSPLGKWFKKTPFDSEKRRYFLRHFLPGFLGFETDTNIQARAEKTKEEIIAPHYGDANILLVTHNDYMKHLIYILLEKDPTIFTSDSPANASITIVSHDKNGYQLKAYNQTDHLSELAQ